MIQSSQCGSLTELFLTARKVCFFYSEKITFLLGDEGIICEETDVWASLKYASEFGTHGCAEGITCLQRKRQGSIYSFSKYLLIAYYV